MTGALFELQQVSHGFPGGTLALDQLDLTISPGGCVALMGCNGAGKSTLLHILAGLVSPVEGQVLWQGKQLSPSVLNRSKPLRTDFRRQVGIVFQDPDSQWLCDTVLDEVMYGPLQIWPEDEAVARVTPLLQVMGVEHLSGQPPYVLSGGEKRRVALASVISMDPEELLLDEPTTSLDAATIDFLLDWLNEYIARPGKTLIMATHDLDLVRELADRCIVLTPCHKLARHDTTANVLSDEELLRQMNLVSRKRGRSSHLEGPAQSST